MILKGNLHKGVILNIYFAIPFESLHQGSFTKANRDFCSRYDSELIPTRFLSVNVREAYFESLIALTNLSQP